MSLPTSTSCSPTNFALMTGKTQQGPVFFTLIVFEDKKRNTVVMLKLHWIRSKPRLGLACWSWPQHIAVAWSWGVCMCQVPWRQRHMSVSSAAIRGRNVRCLLHRAPGPNAGGSQSANLWKAELECSAHPQGLSAGLPLCLDKGADMQINLSPPPPSLSWPLEVTAEGGKK